MIGQSFIHLHAAERIITYLETRLDLSGLAVRALPLLQILSVC